MNPALVSLAKKLMLAPCLLLSGCLGPSQEVLELRETLLSGDPARVEALVTTRPESLEQDCGDGIRPLMAAAFTGQEPLAAFLLERGADVRATDDQGATALHHVGASGSVPIARLLLDRGAELDARDEDGWTPFCWAVDAGAIDLLRFLLDEGADPTRGGDAVISTVARLGLRDVFESMLARGVDVRQHDVNGETVLHSVARGGVTLEEERILAHLEGQPSPEFAQAGRAADHAGIAEILIELLKSTRRGNGRLVLGANDRRLRCARI